MTAYYNEIDPYAAQWLRNLIAAGHIAPGEVDERSIVDVQPDDLRGFTQCRFFAGIGGWSYALRLAGWPDDRPVWTGSCPCKPFSSATRGRGLGKRSSEHLWPAWHKLIVAHCPSIVLGEQIENARAWLDDVCADMEAVGYSCDAAILPAYCVGQDHARKRIYFAGHSNRNSEPGVSKYAKVEGMPWHRSDAGGVARSYGIPGRVGRLRAYGNAIVPQVAAAFIQTL